MVDFPLPRLRKRDPRKARRLVQAHLDVPDDYDPAIKPAVDFVRACVQGDADASSLRFAAMETCRAMRDKHPGAAYVFHLSGLVAYINDNAEAATQFWGRAVLADDTYVHSRTALEEMLAGDPDWTDAVAYLAALADGEDVLVGRYISSAQAHFDAGRWDEADRLNQRASAFRRVDVSKLGPVAACRAESAAAKDDGTLAARYQGVAEKYRRYWGAVDADTISRSHAEWVTLPDRRQLAQLTAAAAMGVPGETCRVFELGCLAGFNLSQARDALPDAERGRVTFGGLEPNADAVAFGKAQFPWAEFVTGSIQDMTAGKLQLPERIDVCVVSRLFMILHPDDVAAIFAYLRERVGAYVICDDIMNVDGEFPILRRPPDFLVMHPFRALLEANGYRIDGMEMAAEPDRECTGFIIAARGG